MKRHFFLLAIFYSLLCADAFSQNKKLDSLLKAVLLEKADTSKAKTYFKITTEYLRKGQADSAALFGHKSRALSKKQNFIKGMAVSSNQLGQATIYLGFPDSAIFYFNASLNYYQQLNDTSRVAGMLNNLALVYRDKGNVPEAMKYYFQSLKMKEQLHDSEGIANACYNLGHVYSESHDTVNSIKYHQRALDIRKKINDRSNVGASMVAIGLFYKNSNKKDLALQYIQEALKIAEELEEEESIAIASYNIGSILYDQGKFKESTVLLNKALLLSRKNRNPKGIASCLQSLGQLELTGNKNPKAAIVFLEEAIAIATEIESADIVGGTSEKLSEAYEKLGDHKKALYYFKTMKTIADSLFNEENVRKLTSESLKYEHEKEKLIVQKEQEKRDALASAEAFRKNLIIGVSVLFLFVISGFSYSIYNKLKQNRKQKLIIEEQQKEMIDSINYAKRIQFALLAHTDLLKQNLPEHFVLFKPKDIVSGDFYWGTLKNEYFYLAVCDCTGHGVPGAFMSLLNINFLNEAINEKNITAPGEILDHVRNQLIKKLDGGRDGMDAVLLRIPVKRDGALTLHYAAANNSGMVMRDGQMIELAKDAMPIGLGEKNDSFKTHTIQIHKGDSLYLYTDGFADQFGGPKGKKFKYKQLDAALLANALNPLHQQAQNMTVLFENWRGELEQVDDVCVFGMRF